jgi:misacylated tRNA(Ala) deacylase
MSCATAALGRLACQHNSFLKEFSTQVLSCTRVPDEKNVFDVVCNDSVLFPEGGGQPGDLGTLRFQSLSDERSQVAFPVTKTFPQNGQCVIRTTHEFHPGDSITMTVDWKRRYDHMQQHSAQHLISAIAESPPLNVQTTTWSLGATRCNIELDSTAITQMQLDTLERQVNEAIASAKPVSLHYQDNTSNVRLVVIEGLDTNPCCGTHVQHTGQLQVHASPTSA